MAVLVFEIWLDYRRETSFCSSQSTTGLLRLLYRIMTLGSSNISPRSLAIDRKVGWIVTLVGIPSAFILHGYVGFIFGSLKANPWWNSPLMPVVFIFSAMVSGIAAVMLLYMAHHQMRKLPIDMPCVDTIAMYLFYIFILDFSLEMLDLIHRVYEADESFRSLNFMVHTRLYFSQIVLQICIGTLVPIILLGDRSGHQAPRASFASASMSSPGAWCRSASSPCAGTSSSAASCSPRASSDTPPTRWPWSRKEGLLVAIFLTILPLCILWVLLKLLPPWPDKDHAPLPAATPAQ